MANEPISQFLKGTSSMTPPPSPAAAPPPKKTQMLDAGQMDRELLQEQQQRAAALHQPLHGQRLNRRLTDAEIIEQGYLADDTINFEVPAEIIPDGMVYQWFAYEVHGNPDQRLAAYSAERRGWRAVPADRHPGIWTQVGFSGPIELGGQRLYELPEAEAYNRARGQYLKAKMQKQDANARLYAAPPGTGPRTHPGVRPQINVTREPLAVE